MYQNEATRKATTAQMDSLLNLYEIDSDRRSTFATFTDGCTWDAILTVIFITWRGVTIGIEADGHAHS